MQAKSPSKSSEQVFVIAQSFFVLKELLMLHLSSKTIYQWLLDEIVNKRWVLPDRQRVKT